MHTRTHTHTHRRHKSKRTAYALYQPAVWYDSRFPFLVTRPFWKRVWTWQNISLCLCTLAIRTSLSFSLAHSFHPSLTSACLGSLLLSLSRACSLSRSLFRACECLLSLFVSLSISLVSSLVLSLFFFLCYSCNLSLSFSLCLFLVVFVFLSTPPAPALGLPPSSRVRTLFLFSLSRRRCTQRYAARSAEGLLPHGLWAVPRCPKEWSLCVAFSMCCPLCLSYSKEWFLCVALLMCCLLCLSCPKESSLRVALSMCCPLCRSCPKLSFSFICFLPSLKL